MRHHQDLWCHMFSIYCMIWDWHNFSNDTKIMHLLIQALVSNMKTGEDKKILLNA